MSNGSIFVSGAGGVGKTTLLEALYADRRYVTHFGAHALISEVARQVIADRSLKTEDMNTNKDDVFWKLQWWIVEAQSALEKGMCGERQVFSDRCCLDALVYAILKFPSRFEKAGCLTSNGTKALKLLLSVGAVHKDDED